MDFIFTDQNLNETCYAAESVSADIDIGVDNDFVVTIPLSDYSPDMHVPGGYFFIPGTEIGGKLSNPTVDTEDETVTFEGFTFRGWLDNRYTTVPSGQDYFTVSGELNSVISTIVGQNLGSHFKVSGVNTGVNVNCQIGRYYSLLEAINQVLGTVGYRLKITATEGDTLSVMLNAEPINRLEDTGIEISQDTRIKYTIQKVTEKYEYMLFLGSGELRNRDVRFFRLNSNGSITQVSSIPNGVLCYKYDYSNAENSEGLLTEIKNKFKDINKTNNQSLSIEEDMGLELGDVVSGRDYVTGIYISEAVSRIVVKYERKLLTYSYELGVQ